MIAVDASVLIPWLDRRDYPQTRQLSALARSGDGVLAAVTITEMLSDPKGSGSLAAALAAFPVLPVADGYWERAGRLRARVRKAGNRAALGDSLIAQACIDAKVALLTRDSDFAAFTKLGGLKLA
jgi:predicted nucleic acid-binding protein